MSLILSSSFAAPYGTGPRDPRPPRAGKRPARQATNRPFCSSPALRSTPIPASTPPLNARTQTPDAGDGARADLVERQPGPASGETLGHGHGRLGAAAACP